MIDRMKPAQRMGSGGQVAALWLVFALDSMPSSAHAATDTESTTPATRAEGFGHRQQMFISLGSESLLQVIWAPDYQQTFSIAVEPAFGYFFTERLFARLAIAAQFDQYPRAAQDIGDSRTSALSSTLGLGSAWYPHAKITIAPWVGAGVGRIWRSATNGGYRSTVHVEAAVPCVFDFIDHFSLFASPSYQQLVVNRETFPDGSRNATLGGTFGISMGALAYW